MGPAALGWTAGTACHGAPEAALTAKRRANGIPDANVHRDPAVAHLLVIDHLTGEREDS